jgi:hypothetical protein
MLEELAGIRRQQSRRVLLTGLAGEAVRTGGSLLYDSDRVAALAGWSAVDQSALLGESPGGVLVARLGRGQDVSVLAPWAEVAASQLTQTDLGLAAWLQVKAYLDLHRRLPFVAMVCGFPVLLADVVSLAAVSGWQLGLGLEAAGPWRRLVDGHRFVTGPGPPWLLLGHQPYLGRAQRARDRAEPVGAGRATTWARWA